jgi:hypothetical protein
MDVRTVAWLKAQSRDSVRVRSHTEQDLENIFVGEWLEFGYLPKTAAVIGRGDEMHCHGTEDN